MTHRELTQSQIAAVHANAPAERLFFTQYRLWMAGYSSRDADYWDCAFDVLLRFAARESAKLLHGEFHLFTRTLNEWASKTYQVAFLGLPLPLLGRISGVETDHRLATKR